MVKVHGSMCVHHIAENAGSYRVEIAIENIGKEEHGRLRWFLASD